MCQEEWLVLHNKTKTVWVVFWVQNQVENQTFIFKTLQFHSVCKEFCSLLEKSLPAF